MNLEIEQIEDLLRTMQPRAVSDDRKRRIEAAVSLVCAQDPLRETIATSRPSPLPSDLA